VPNFGGRRLTGSGQ
jgi:hypothetical protein